MRVFAEELRIGGQLAFAVLLLALRPTSAPTHQHHHYYIPVSVPVPMPIAIAAPRPSPAPTVPATCPAMVREAPAANPKQFPDDITRVTASLTDARWLAAWNDQHVFVSRDGGGTFTRVLDGPGAVMDVTFDCFGHAIVLRDRALVGIDDRWLHAPGLRGEQNDPNSLVGGGPDVIVLGIGEGDSWQARLAITHDLGASWTFRDLTPYYESRNVDGRQKADGRIELAMAFADCMNDPMHWYTIAGDKLVDDDLTAAPGKLYLHGDIAYADNQWRRMNQHWRDISGLPVVEGLPISVHALGVVPRAIGGDTVYRLRDGVATPMHAWPQGVEPLEVDLAGRIWGLEAGRLVIVSPRGRAKA